MSIAIHSSSAAVVASRAAEAASVSQGSKPEHVPKEAVHGHERSAPAGRNALVAALQDALGTLMPVAQEGAAAATEPGAAGEATASTGSADLKQALHEFTHELFSALRPVAGEEGARSTHARGFGWGHASLGDLAQRLEALAQSLGATPSAPAPVDTGEPAPSAQPVVEAPPAEAPTAEAAVDTTAAAPAATTPEPVAEAPVEDAPPVSVVVEPAPSSETVAAKSPLLAAFEQLVAARSGSAAATSASDQLAAFLHQMAQALQADPHAEVPAAGGLLDTTA